MSPRCCPVCPDVTLEEQQMSGQTIDRCPSCRGQFYDRGELEALADLARIFQGIALKEPEIPSGLDPERGPRSCPADGTELVEREAGGVLIDTCAECGGIWLDDGEIVALKLAEAHIRANLGLYLRLGQ